MGQELPHEPTLGFKPSDRQQQFGGTFGGPIKTNRIFFFAGYDQHIFHVPTVVNFLSGGSVLVPQAGTGPAQAGDYEDCPSTQTFASPNCDKAQVFAAASQLNALAGTFHSDLLGNTGFLKGLIRRGEIPLVRASDADSVVTSSSPLSLRVEFVIGLAGSKKTLFAP